MGTKTDILKEDAVEMFGSKAKLSRALGISKTAVGNWPDKKPIPELQALRIRYILKPELFAA